MILLKVFWTYLKISKTEKAQHKKEVFFLLLLFFGFWFVCSLNLPVPLFSCIAITVEGKSLGENLLELG